ncbi:hypothetical protein RE6C_02852 [Rhodopirellula europaea 6C]|uniref:Uncharacterized protein n=1 Tax=Rhodopirellula europaea 6C TaxID=1263867 RepID=M2AUY0_9BACT|nr:hypothetical protein RE6C_02852 [Rhodopirellula europaea 6C]
MQKKFLHKLRVEMMACFDKQKNYVSCCQFEAAFLGAGHRWVHPLRARR